MGTWRQQARAAGWSPARAARTPRVVENAEYVAMVRRVLRRLGQRAGEDPTALRDLAELAADVNAALTNAVDAARNQSTPPYSWSEIGRELGVSKQAAQQRYGEPTAKTTAA